MADPASPLPSEVADAVSAVVEQVEAIADTPEGLAALEAAVAYGVAEGHDE